MIVSVAVVVDAPVIVAALVNGNDIVDVVDAVDDRKPSLGSTRSTFETSNVGDFRASELSDQLVA